MVYAYDQDIQLPTRDIYDTAIMQMSIAAAKDMYEKGQQEMKDFQKAYGDFLTPIMADQDWYNKNVTGRVRDAVNALYAQGIDPLRNAQGRAAISQIINSIPVGEIAKLRTSAANANEYLKNRGKLEAAGLYNSDLEERFLGYDINNWNTIANGAWDRQSPTEMKTLKELTQDWYNNRTARDLTKADLEAAGIPYDPRYQYSGYLDSDLMNVARGNTPGWNDTVYSRYYRDLAKQKLQRNGINDPTQAQIESVLQRDIANAQQEWLINPTKKVDEYAMKDYDYAQKVALENLRHSHAMDKNGRGNNPNSDEYDSAEGLFYRGLIHSGGTDSYADSNLEKAVEDARDNIIDRQVGFVNKAKSYGYNSNQARDYILNQLSIKESPENFAKYIGRTPITKGNGGRKAVVIDSDDIEEFYSAEALTDNMYGVRRVIYKDGKRTGYAPRTKTDRSFIKPGMVANPMKEVETMFVEDENGQYVIGQFWKTEVSTVDEDGDLGEVRTYYRKLPGSRAITSNMPEYQQYKKNKKLGRPNITVDRRTKGLKNTGSQRVNNAESIPQNPSYFGTRNSEAVTR